jgi:hypothetical protein
MSLGILVVRSHLELFLRFGLNLKLLWPGQSIEQQASSLFLDYYKNGFFVVAARACLLSLKTVSLDLPGNMICCLSSNQRVSDVWHMSRRFCFFLLFCCFCLLLLFVCLVVQISATSDWHAHRVGGRACRPCPHAQGTLLVVALVCHPNCHCCGACAACVDHDDNNGSHHRGKRTVSGSCAGQ